MKKPGLKEIVSSLFKQRKDKPQEQRVKSQAELWYQ